MKKLIMVVVCMTALALVGAAVWAQSGNAPSTSGLTTVNVTTGSGTGSFAGCYFYDFALTNNTNAGAPLNDGTQDYVVLVDKLEVDLTGLLPKPLAGMSTQPLGWSWTDNGWERFTADPNEKYNVGPSAGPGQTLTGFRYYFAGPLPAQPVTGLAFTTHVLAVAPEPISTGVYPSGSKKNPNPLGGQTYFHYQGLTINNLGPTWYDQPRPVNPHPHPRVPEASSLFLGCIGLVGPIGYALRKRIA